MVILWKKTAKCARFHDAINENASHTFIKNPIIFVNCTMSFVVSKALQEEPKNG